MCYVFRYDNLVFPIDPIDVRRFLLLIIGEQSRLDNEPCLLQTARHLLKCCESAAAGKQVHGSAAYLSDSQAETQRRCQVQSGSDWRASDMLLAALR